MIVVSSPARAEQLLVDGEIPCPACRGVLRPHGHGRIRTVRGMGAARVTVTPRRARCGDCGATQVLLPAALTSRLADATEVVGNALLAKAKRRRVPDHRGQAGPPGIHGAALAAPGPRSARRMAVPAWRSLGHRVRRGTAGPARQTAEDDARRGVEPAGRCGTAVPRMPDRDRSDLVADRHPRPGPPPGCPPDHLKSRSIRAFARPPAAVTMQINSLPRPARPLSPSPA